MSTILIYTSNQIQSTMAGPAIRCWEFAKALSRSHQVVLVTPNTTNIKGEGFTILAKESPEFKIWIKKANVLIAQNLTLSMAWQAKRNGIKIIIDAYDPLPLELLELFKHNPLKNRESSLNASINQLIFNFQMADGIICASEKQRDLWIGFLLAHHLVTCPRYDQDKSLRHLIDVVPFGLPEQKAQKDGIGLREKYHLNPDDKILLWGGGIWNWFDPLTLIKAIKKINLKRSDIKLVFMGVKNPDPSVPEMAMALEAVNLAKELNLLDQSVFFNHSWVPYNERHNSLLDATIGVSTHFDHLETSYSFRTRILDYMWTGLPILATQGDSFAELIEQKKLGKIVPYEDEQALAESIMSMIDQPETLTEFKNHLESFAPHYQWNQVIRPIEKMIVHFSQSPTFAIDFKTYKTLVAFVFKQVIEKGLKNTLKLIVKKVMNKMARFVERSTN